MSSASGFSPRAGTVTADVGRVIREYKAGKVEFRNDKGGNLHAVVGKLSFDPQKLQWVAAEYVKLAPLERKVDGVIPVLQRAGLLGDTIDRDKIAKRYVSDRAPCVRF